MAIFQKVVAEERNVINKVVEIEVMKIMPNPAQPRVVFGDYELSQLAVSIQQNGILQPLTVREVSGNIERGERHGKSDVRQGEKCFELIAGERRLRAAKLAGLEKVPCIIMEATGEKSAVLAIMENIQRADLNYIEEAFAISRMIEYLNITQEEAAVKLGIAQSTVANKLRLLKLSDEEKAMALRFRLNERQARALLKLPPGLRVSAIEKIGSGQLNTIEADKLIAEMLKAETTPPKPPKRARGKQSFFVRQTQLYINTFNQAIDSMKKAGISCTAKKNKTDEFVEYIVRIPLN